MTRRVLTSGSAREPTRRGMAYREVTMIEIKEVLRRWVSGTPKKRIAAQLELDPRTVRRYVKATVTRSRIQKS